MRGQLAMVGSCTLMPVNLTEAGSRTLTGVTAAKLNHTLSPNSLNEARIGYTRFNFAAVPPVNVLDPASVGFTGIKVQDPTVASWPRIDVSGFFSLGFSSNGPQPRIDQTYQVSDNFSNIRGRHTIKVGYDMRRFEVYNPFFSTHNGRFRFLRSGV